MRSRDALDGRVAGGATWRGATFGVIAGSLTLVASWASAHQGPIVVGLAWIVAGVVVTATCRTEWLVALVVLAAFASRFSVLVAGFHVRPEHVATLALVLGVLLRGDPTRLGRALFTRPASYLGTLVAYGAISSALFAPNFRESMAILAWLFLDWLLLASLLTIQPDSAMVTKWLSVGVVGSSAYALLAWLNAVTRGGLVGIQRSQESPVPAAFGFSSEANILAGLLTLCVLVLIAARGRRRLIVVALALGAIPVTQTRAAMLAIAVALPALFLTAANDIVRKRMVAIAAVTVALGVALTLAGANLAGPLFSKFGALDSSSTNIAYRTRLSSLALGDLDSLQSWVFGLGVNSFGQRHLDPSRPGEHAAAYLSNLPLQILYDTGIVGVAIVVALLVYCLRITRSRLAFPMVLGYLVLSSATSPFWFAFTWLFVAMSVSGSGGISRSLSGRGETSQELPGAVLHGGHASQPVAAISSRRVS